MVSILIGMNSSRLPRTSTSLCWKLGEKPPRILITADGVMRGAKLVQADIAKQLKRGMLSEAAARSQAARLSPTLVFADLAR